MGKVVCPWDLITNFVTDAFIGYGVPEEDAKICTDILLESDKRGIESHGCNRFKPIYLDRIKAGIQNPVTNFEIVKETPCTAVVDGHDGMGQVIGYKAMQMAIDKAKQYGMGMVAVRNSCHYGIAGYYTTMATKQGCIGMTGTNARPSVAPLSALRVCSAPTLLQLVFLPTRLLILTSTAPHQLPKTAKLSITRE